ncbi:hypothetical protein BX070DRAFT_244940 [Coemansia spiralis]|nr:hypothetical protein BX070DRAFT_244940 [Coemansia spiralis]
MNFVTSVLPIEILIIRDGVQAQTIATSLIQGDTVHLHGSDKAPADLHLIGMPCDLCFDRSMLAGESNAAVAAVAHIDESYLEIHNVAVMGSYVTQGPGIGVVVATRNSTVMGRIVEMTT